MVASRPPRAGAGRTRRLLGALGWGLIAISLAAALLTVAGLALVQARGEQVMVVVSGSMTPTFRAGDAVLVRPAEAADLQPGTVISFHAAGDPDHLTTHRIVARVPRADGLFLQTRGDANATPDPNYVAAGSVVGVMSESVPYLGRWLAFFQSRSGRIVVLALPLLLLAGAQALGTLREIRRTPGRRPPGRRRVRGTAVLTTAVVVVSVVSGAVIARTTSAVFNEQVPHHANAFATAAYCGTGTTYQQAVVADSPVIYHRFSETTGTSAANTGSGTAGTYTGGYTLGAAGATACEATSNAVRLNGSSGHVVMSATAATASPAAFTVEAWFRTTTGGGKIVGFGNQRVTASASGSTDRHLYLSNTGAIYFGVNRSSKFVISSPQTYLDGRWHHVAATLGATGMRLYVDGAEVAFRTDVTTAGASYTGFWRIGYDSLTGWTAAPSNLWFTGDIDEVAIFATALTATRIAAHYDERRG